MQEKKVIFRSGSVEIEGLFKRNAGNKGVIIAHPHPLYGGSMLNNVVESLCIAYGECGYSTLRFNFRGVGQSGGTYDNGEGEQSDVKAAVYFVIDEGIREIELAGYSFGSWVIARAFKACRKINRIVLVSPPVDLFDYSSVSNVSEIKLVIAGSEDNVADWRSIEKILPRWNPGAVLRVIYGADHFYWGHSDELRKIVKELLEAR
jgi:uncharacterized protein